MDTITYASVQVNVRDSTPYRHTNHDDGSFSIRLTPSLDAFAVYLNGTPDELSDFVDRLGSAVIDAQKMQVTS